MSLGLPTGRCPYVEAVCDGYESNPEECNATDCVVFRQVGQFNWERHGDDIIISSLMGQPLYKLGIDALVKWLNDGENGNMLAKEIMER